MHPGLLGITLFQGGWAYGLSLTTASKASILVTIAPVFGALISGFSGTWPSAKAWIGIALSLCGTFIVINNSLTSLTLGAGSIKGDLLIIFAAAVWALYTAVNRPLLSVKGPIFVTAWSMLFGASFLALIDLPGLVGHDWGNMSAASWGAWSFTAILGAALAFVWYCSGIARLGMTRGMVYSFLIPFIAIFTAFVFLGETMSSVQILGGMVALCGVWLTRIS